MVVTERESDGGVREGTRESYMHTEREISTRIHQKAQGMCRHRLVGTLSSPDCLYFFNEEGNNITSSKRGELKTEGNVQQPWGKWRYRTRVS